MAKFNIKTVKPKFVVATTPETKIDVSINRPIIDAKNQKAYFKLKNTGGPKGEKGDPGTAATITVGSTSTGAPGTSASVTNAGTSSAAVLDFTIPRGDKGDKGDTGATGSPGVAATISVGTTTTGQPGTNASVTNVGTSSAAVLNFTIPKGAKGDTGATGAPGATGSPGAAATVSVGSTQTGNPGTSASVVNSGTSSAAVLDFTIPRGDKGDQGNPGSAATIAVGTVTTLQPNQSAYVTNVGTSSAAVFDIGIPKGEQGQAGSGSGDMLAANYDPNGTVANAGGIVNYVASEIPPLYTELGENTDGPITQKASREALYVDSGKTVVKLGTKAFSTDTYGARSTSVGAGTRAGGDNSVAVGDSSSAMGSYAIAVGSGATTGAGTNSISIGHNAKTNSGAIYSNSVALGASATATRDYEVNVGTGIAAGFDGNNDHTRVIAGVHAGVLNTDAVNVGQLNAAIPTKTSELTNDGSDNTSTYVEADELAAVATSGSYNDLSGAPAIPTVNDATLTINQNGVSAGTFTANASSNTTISLTDTTYSAMTGATSGTAGASGLVPQPNAGDEAKVLSGAATWVAQPTVNDATLTIQKNGQSLGTFTANASSNTSISVPAPAYYNLTNGATLQRDYGRSVIALCQVSTTNSTSLHSWSSGSLRFHRSNGMNGAVQIMINCENQYSTAYATNVSYISNIEILPTTANLDDTNGWRPCTFKYNNVWYGGIEIATAAASMEYVSFDGAGNFDVFGLDYYKKAYTASGTSHPAEVLNQEIYDSLDYSKWSRARNHWYVGDAVRETIYTSTSGTNASFTTTSAMSNYDEVEITYRDANSNYALKRVPGAAGSFVLDIAHPGANSTVQWYISRWTINGANATVSAACMRKAIASTSLSTFVEKDIYITRITGIKY